MHRTFINKLGTYRIFQDRLGAARRVENEVAGQLENDIVGEVSEIEYGRRERFEPGLGLGARPAYKPERNVCILWTPQSAMAYQQFLSRMGNMGNMGGYPMGGMG
ncbi:unnamed protein product, partial [Adineta steineri]